MPSFRNATGVRNAGNVVVSKDVISYQLGHEVYFIESGNVSAARGAAAMECTAADEEFRGNRVTWHPIENDITVHIWE
jgi:hypothetical protein